MFLLHIHFYQISEPPPISTSTAYYSFGTGVLGPEDLFIKEIHNVDDVRTVLYCNGMVPPDDVACLNAELATFTDQSGTTYNGSPIYGPFFEFGEPGDEDETLWQQKYLYGGEGCEAPADQYPPTVYAHFFHWDEYVVIQYWIFYPYDNWVINHEGDWEHINVVISQDMTSIVDMDFYIHNRYYTPSLDDGVIPNLTVLREKINIIDDTHPVIYVGGTNSDYTCHGGSGGGDTSGASYPAPGFWRKVTELPTITGCDDLSDDQIPSLKYIPYSRVHVEWMPQIQSLVDGGPGVGRDYFLQHPEKAWMRAQVRFGEYSTSIPGGLDDISNLFGYDTNISPFNPRYQSTWETRYGGGFTRYKSVRYDDQGYQLFDYPLYNPDHQLFVEAELQTDNEVAIAEDLQMSISDPSAGTGQYATPARYSWSGEGRTIQITAPQTYSANGTSYIFQNWTTGATTPILDLPLQEHTTHAVAVYEVEPTGFQSFSLLQNSPIKGASMVPGAVSVADYNQDGHADLYISYERRIPEEYPPRNRMCYGVGDGTFVDVTPSDTGGALANEGAGTAVAAGDIDNDGLIDLYIANGDAGCSDCPNVLAHNQSSPGYADFVVDATNTGVDDPGPSSQAELVDFDNDGLLDLLLGRTSSATNRLYYNSGGGQFLELPESPLAAFGGDALAVGDYDNDRFQDVIATGTGGVPHLFRNTSNENELGYIDFEDVTAEAFAGSSLLSNVTCLAFGEFDNDGDLDLLVGNDFGYLQLWRNEAGSFTEVRSAVALPERIAHSARVELASWVDYDNDGDLDLFVSGEEIQLFRNDSGTFADASDQLPQPPASPKTASWFDANDDGRLDLFLGLPDDTINQDHSSWLLENNLGLENHWLHLDLDGSGTLSNRSGIGARIRVVTNAGQSEYRNMGAGTGGNSLGPLAADIGLGQANGVDLVEVLWPSGRTSQLTNVPQDGSVVVSEEPVAVVGSIYLSLDASNLVSSPPEALDIGQEFTFYLMADIDPSAVGEVGLMGFEARVDLGTRVEIVNEQMLANGSNEATDEGEYKFTFNSCVDLSSGPVALVQFTARIPEEGSDVAVQVTPAGSCSFQDPVEPAAPVWFGCNFGGMYRLDVTGGLELPLNDTHPPHIVSTELVDGQNDAVSVLFQEPIDENASDGTTAGDLSHWEVFKTTDISQTIQIDQVLPLPGSQDFYVHLSSDIPEGEGYSIRVKDLQDLHLNAMTPQVQLVTYGPGGPLSALLSNRSVESNIDTGTDPGVPRKPLGAASLDFNEDGLMDLAIAIEGGVLQLFQNVTLPGQPSAFQQASPDNFKDNILPGNSRNIAVADINNDGRPGFFSASESNPALFLSSDPAVTSYYLYDATSETQIPYYGTESWSATWGDYDADGWVDLYICRAQGDSLTPDQLSPTVDRLLRSNGLASNNGLEYVAFELATDAGALAAVPSVSSAAAWADADGDGDLDIVVGSLEPTGSSPGTWTGYYINDGEGGFTEVASATSGPRMGKIGYVSDLAFADADGDGDNDLIISRQNPYLPGAQKGLMFCQNQGDGVFSWWTPFDTSPDHPMNALSAADLDLDGVIDVTTVPTESNAWPLLYRYDDASGTWSEHAADYGMTQGTAKALASADFNCDGDLDLYLSRPNDPVSPNFFFENNRTALGGASYAQIGLRSLSHGNNGMGIGSKITLTAGANQYVKWINDGSGSDGQPSVLTFGLGDYTNGTVDVNVEWPDGFISQSAASVGQRTTIEDTHDPGLQGQQAVLLVILSPEGVADWLFTWYTTYSSDSALDQVQIISPTPTVIQAGDLDVAQTYRKVAGGYYHELRWLERDCTPWTEVHYKVGSGVATPGHPMEWSSEKTYLIKFCIKAF